MMGAGLVLYQLYLGMTAYLAFVLWRDHRQRVFPAFTAYVSACLLKSSLLFPLWAAGYRRLYAVLFWELRPVMFFLAAAVAVELLAQAYVDEKITAARPTAALVLPALLLAVAPSLALDRGLRLATSAALAGLLPRLPQMAPPARAIAGGLLVITMLPAASETMRALLPGSALQFVPTASATLATAIWIRAFTVRD